jgi:hypothetical protein
MLYLDYLKDSKLVLRGVVVQEADVKGEYRLLVEDGEGIREVQCGFLHQGMQKCIQTILMPKRQDLR